MIVTIVCRDTIDCKVTIVLCNGAQKTTSNLLRINLKGILKFNEIWH